MIRVTDFAASYRFYATLLGALGHQPDREEKPRVASWRDFVVAEDGKRPTKNLHLAFVASSRVEVDVVHRAVIEAGYEDNGPPGDRSQYHDDYYGEFICDLDGNKPEAV